MVNSNKRLDFICNPFAGGKSGEKIKNAILKIETYLNEKQIPYKIHFTPEEHGSKLKTEELIKNGATSIVAVGGDGTLHEVINGFSNFENVTLGLVPCGTGNDFASAMGIPEDTIEALKIILKNTPKYTDFMQMPTVRGINVIGMGIDVDVLVEYSKANKKTKATYTKALLKTLIRYKDKDFIRFNGTDGEKDYKYKSFLVCACNGIVFGGGIPICPPAKIDDGKLDFITVESMKKLKMISAFLKLKKGKILDIKGAHHSLCKEISFKADRPVFVNVDGELYHNIPFNVKVVTNTLKMYR